MPYVNKEKAREASRLAMQRLRNERKKSGEDRDPEWLEAERRRKAAWYAANKEKKAEAQRKYRARKKKEKSL